MSNNEKDRNEEIIERSHRAAEHERLYKAMLAEIIWNQKKYKTIAEILEEADIPRFHYNNVANPDKIKPGSERYDDDEGKKKAGKPYSFPVDWIEKTIWAFGDHTIMVELGKNCGGLYLTPKDLQELSEIDLEDTDKIGKVLKKLKSLTKKAK